MSHFAIAPRALASCSTLQAAETQWVVAPWIAGLLSEHNPVTFRRLSDRFQTAAIRASILHNPLDSAHTDFPGGRSTRSVQFGRYCPSCSARCVGSPGLLQNHILRTTHRASLVILLFEDHISSRFTLWRPQPNRFSLPRGLPHS